MQQVNMDHLQQEYGRVYCEIKQLTDEDIAQCFEAEKVEFSVNLMSKITALRDDMRGMCESQLLKLSKAAQNINLDIGELPKLLPPYEPLLEVLDQRYAEVAKLAEARQAKINRYFHEAADIADSIGIRPPQMPVNLHESSIDALKQSLIELRADRARRIERLTNLLDQAMPLYQELGHEATATGLSEDPFTNLKDAQLQILDEKVKELRVLKEKRRELSETLKKEIAFYAEHLQREITLTGELSETYLDQLVRTRDNMASEVKEKIAGCIQQATEKYIANCKTLFIEPISFPGEQTVETHELILAENKKLQGLLSMRERIDKAYQDFKGLLADEKLLEEAEKNPHRFKERGSVLLEENKRRNRVSSRKPMVVKKITSWVSEWEKKVKKPYLVDEGQELKTIIDLDRAKNSRKPTVRAARVAMDAINNKHERHLTKTSNKSVARATVNPIKRPVRPALTAQTRPTFTRSSQSKEPKQPIFKPASTRAIETTQSVDKIPTPSSSRPALRSLDAKNTGNRAARIPAPQKAAASLHEAFCPENLSTMESPAATPASPSIKASRNFQRCNKLTYKPERSVSVPIFDPDFSMLELDASAHTFRVAQDKVYLE